MTVPRKLSVVGGKRTTVAHDSRREEYKDYNKMRWKYDKEVMQFYNSKRWRDTSKLVLLENNYVCEMCGGEATMTDHVVPVKQNWSLRFERSNHKASCKSCNDAKAIRDKHNQS